MFALDSFSRIKYNSLYLHHQKDFFCTGYYKMLAWFDQRKRLNGTNKQERYNARERFKGWQRKEENSTFEFCLSGQPWCL